MNKTISINLGGHVFQIDENAYEVLKKYLESIRSRFSQTEGKDEIISDIESRISEMFTERLSPKSQVITLTDVNEVVNIMGRPEEFDSGIEDDQEYESSEQTTNKSRRLYRNPDDKVLGGVCSGLTAYLGMNDPLWLRIIFLLAFFFGVGGSFIVYIILWLILPEAKTTSQKLEMKGEHINISNIEKTIKEDLSDLKDKFSNLRTDGRTRKAHNFLEKLVDTFIALFVFLFKLVFKIVAFALILAGIAIVIASVITILLPVGILGFLIPPLYPLLFTSSLLAFLAGLSLLLLVGIPAFWFVYMGFRILLNRRMQVRGLGIGFAGLWTLGWLLAFFVATKTAVDFKDDSAVVENITLKQPAGDILYLSVNRSGEIQGDDVYDFFGEGEIMLMENKMLVKDRVKLDVKRSLSNEYTLTSTSSARGRTNAKAYDRASAINYLVNQDDSVIYFNDFFTVEGEEQQFRDQEISLVLKVPVGKSVFLEEATSEIIYDIKNTTKTHDSRMVGHTWTMLSEGLTCADCNWKTTPKGDIATEGKVTRRLEYEDFDEIEIGGSFEILIDRGDVYDISIIGNQKFVDNMEVDKRGDQLEIKAKNPLYGFFKNRSGTVHVTMPALKDLEINGANESTISGFEQSSMTVDIAGASSVNLDVNADNLKLSVTGASNVTLIGKGDQLDVELSGASNLEAFEYVVDDCTIEVVGASNAEINVKDNLDAECSGASNILYKGLPKISSDVSGFSSIKPEQ